MKWNYFKKPILALSIFAIAFSLTGCSSNKNQSSSASMTLYWWRSAEDAPEAALTDVISGFQQNNPNIKIQVVLKDPRTFEQEALAALAGAQNVTNAPDILSVRGEDLPRYIPQLVAAPTDIYDQALAAKKKTGKSVADMVNDLFVPVVPKSVIFAGQDAPQGLVYGLPMAIDNLALYRNTQLLNDAANRLKQDNKVETNITPTQLNVIKKQIQTAPKTWTELAAIVPYLTVKSGSDISKSAIALGTGSNVERSYDILESMMLQNGTQMTSSDLNTATFNLGQATATADQNLGLKSLDFYLRFANPQDPLYTWNGKMPESIKAFESGQVAMMIQYASAYRFIINEAPQIKNSIDVSALPQIVDPGAASGTSSIKTMSRMWVETATASRGDKARQNASWGFIIYATSKAGSKPYLSAMKIPSALKEGSEKVKFSAFSAQKNISDTWYKGHKAQVIDQAFIGAIDEAAQGAKSAGSALNEVADLATTILKASLAKWFVKTGS